jgi:hypothetical protein
MFPPPTPTPTPHLTLHHRDSAAPPAPTRARRTETNNTNFKGRRARLYARPMSDILLALRDLLIPPASRPPASPRYDAIIAAAARANFPAFYAAHPAAVRNGAALLLGLLLLGAVLAVRAVVRVAAAAAAAATGGAAAVRALEEEEREEDVRVFLHLRGAESQARSATLTLPRTHPCTHARATLPLPPPQTPPDAAGQRVLEGHNGPAAGAGGGGEGGLRGSAAAPRGLGFVVICLLRAGGVEALAGGSPRGARCAFVWNFFPFFPNDKTKQTYRAACSL